MEGLLTVLTGQNSLAVQFSLCFGIVQSIVELVVKLLLLGNQQTVQSQLGEDFFHEARKGRIVEKGTESGYARQV